MLLLALLAENRIAEVFCTDCMLCSGRSMKLCIKCTNDGKLSEIETGSEGSGLFQGS